MCLFSVMYRVFPGCPLLILSNREEFRRRPTAPPRLVTREQIGTSWLGGVDLEAGGTWLGVNQFDLVVAVTNRAKTHVPVKARSRGLLCRDLLQCDFPDQVLKELNRQCQTQPYAGFNLLLFNRERSTIVEALGTPKTIHLEQGIHTITNGSLNDSADPRIQRVTPELQRLAQQEWQSATWLHAAQQICRLRTDGESAAICLTGSDWGTVSSTVIALTNDPAEARYLYAAGPPSKTHYNDYSPLLRQLLRTEK